MVVQRKVRRGKVTTFDVGLDIPDSEFEVQFPNGANIIKREGGNKTYLIKRDETLVPVDRKQFGKLPPSGDLLGSSTSPARIITLWGIAGLRLNSQTSPWPETRLAGG